VNPPIIETETYSEYSFAAPRLPPLSLAYLVSFIDKSKHTIKVEDCIAKSISLEDLKKIIVDFKPDIVGVTATTISYEKARRVVSLAKSINKKTITMMGGAHVSAIGKMVIEENVDLDVAIFGEGEITFKELTDRLEKKEKISDVEGTIVRTDGKIRINKPRGLIQDLDIVPIPDRDLFGDLKVYSHTPLRGTGFIASVMTSRGCPFNCHYCDQSVFTRKWRANSADYVIKELKLLKEKYGVDAISFEDDNFALSKERTIEICKKMIDQNLNLKWSCSARVDRMDDELLLWMRKAGCRSIYIGIESGNQEMLDFINKNITLGQISKAVRMIKKHGIEVYGSFIIGLPKETKKMINQTINFALKLPLDGVSFNLFTPYPNTSLTMVCEDYGTSVKGWENYSDHSGKVAYIPNGMTKEYLLEKQKEAYRKFYVRPVYVLTHLHYVFSKGFIKKSLEAVKTFYSK